MKKLINLPWAELRSVAEQEILKRAHQELAGGEKMDQVVDALRKVLDKAIEPEKPFLETLTDLGIGLLLGALKGLAQEQFDKLRAEGRV